MASLVTRKRYSVSVDRQLSGSTGEVLLSWGWIHQAGDSGLVVLAANIVGRIALRLDGSTTDLLVLETGALLSGTVDLASLTVGRHTLQVVALDPVSGFDTLEVFSQQLEVL